MLKFEITDKSGGFPPVSLGTLPLMFHPFSDDDAKTQIDKRYAHGGGFVDTPGFSLNDEWKEPGEAIIQYYQEEAAPEEQDPPLHELARAKLGEETLIFFPYAFLAIVQPDGSFQVTRVD